MSIELNQPIAFVTGATAGIGEACVWAFAKAGYRLLVCGRRAERLDALKAELEATGAAVHTLLLDVRDSKAVNSAIESLPADWQAIDVLVNNAGLARGLSTVQAGLLNDWDEMIDTNLKGLLYISRAVLPGMVARGKGQVINIGSTAAKEVYPNGNVYCATKHAVDALTRGMRQDLIGTGVRVSSVQPGMVNTEFSTVRFHGDEARADKIYEGFRPLSAQDVADVVLYVAQAPEHVNVADVLLLPADQASVTLIHRQKA
jgi:3-hydroxy acid dehydrogenase / malonic semialdehyde reductase